VDATRWHGGTTGPTDLDALQNAVFSDRRLRLSYRHSGTAGPRTYTVDPYGLVAKAGVWYLVADHRTRPRLFRADRVHEATVLPDDVRRRPGAELADVWETLRKGVEERRRGLEVTARVRRDRLELFRRINAPWLTAEDDRDGDWVTVRLAYDVLGEARQLLQFGAYVEVLDPPDVRTELARAAASVLDLYGVPEGVSPASGRAPR
jgi:predicted DNA-binding transcriptional regulator YafY